MPIARKTSSKGAPKRSASRLDRIPANTRTAPSNMARLTESREAIHLPGTNHWNCILIVGRLPRQPIFALRGNLPVFCGLNALHLAVYRWSGRALCGSLRRPRIKSSRPLPDETDPMDMDLKDFMELVQTTARSVGAEISSPWFYLQFGLILA